uniref:histidine kinase n=1 Tax=candidate division WOR-3 bacterium TaxID=2052148 RepID=A0A7C4CD05_UNCW3
MPFAPPSVQTRPTVLLVDDELAFCAALAAMLESRGYRAVTAGTGADALRLAAAEPPDVALLDLKLPDSTGLDVLANIRRVAPTTEVVILTGYATPGSAASAIGMGAFAFLEKPCTNDRLFLTLEQALLRRNNRAPAAVLAEAILRCPLPAAIVETDSGRILTANPAITTLLGNSEANRSLHGLPVGGSVVESRTTFAAHLQELRASGEAIAELPLRLDGDRTRWFELRSLQVPGWPDRALLLLLDCDARHRAAAADSRARAGFEAIFENLTAGIMVIDSLFEVQQANPAIARILGTTPAELVGRRCYEIMHQRSTPCARHGEDCPIAASLASGTTARAFRKHRDAQGNLRHIEVTAAPIHDDSGTTTSFVAMFTDLTEIETAHEQTRIQAARLAQLNRELTARQHECEAQSAELSAANSRLKELSLAKDDFVATVSHELRTPLTALSESLNLIAESASGRLQGTAAGLLEVAVRNCKRLAELINDLLDFSRIEAGRMEVNPRRLDIGSLIREVCDTFAPGARQKGVVLEYSVPAGLFVSADERIAHRVLCNLVANAVKFTRQGSISVSAAHLDGEVVVSVADTGIGIPETNHGHVFERFFQCNHPGERRPTGTGLGLALCRELVEMSGGRIWFESTEGVGSTFHFTLPSPPEGQIS